MRATLLTLGILLLVAAGRFFPLGDVLVQTFHLPAVPNWLPYLWFAIGGGLVLEHANRTHS